MSAPITLGGANPGRATRGLVLVHGRGADAVDILGLGEALGLPNLALAAPTAPGRSWWPTSFLAPMEQMEPFVLAGLDAVETAIDALLSGGLSRDKIAVAGFSQGGCLALEYAARRGGVAAVFGLSAGLVGTGDANGGATDALYGHAPRTFDYDTDLTGVPVTITVHERDPHIPVTRAQDSLGVLRGLGATAELHVAPGAGHGITPAGVTAMRKALNS